MAGPGRGWGRVEKRNARLSPPRGESRRTRYPAAGNAHSLPAPSPRSMSGTVWLPYSAAAASLLRHSAPSWGEQEEQFEEELRRHSLVAITATALTARERLEQEEPRKGYGYPNPPQQPLGQARLALNCPMPRRSFAPDRWRLRRSRTPHGGVTKKSARLRLITIF